MSNIPKVSVLVPAYNYAHYLDETIQSVLNQTYTDFELVIVDNASKDNTKEVVAKYLTDPRVRYHRHASTIPMVDNWNSCFEHARGEYIKFLCADDKFREDLLEKFVPIFDQYPNVSLVTCNREMFGSKSAIIELPFRHLHEGRKIIYHTLNNYGWLGEPTCVMFRKKNLPETGLYRKEYTWLTDWEMWLRQLAVGDCYFVPEPLAIIRNHQGQVTKRVTKHFINYFEEYQLCENIKNHDGYTIDTSGIDMRKVMRRRALNCGKAMIRVMPELYRKDRWAIFLKAARIVLKEGVLFPFLVDLVKRKPTRRKILKQTQIKVV